MLELYKTVCDEFARLNLPHFNDTTIFFRSIADYVVDRYE